MQQNENCMWLSKFHYFWPHFMRKDYRLISKELMETFHSSYVENWSLFLFGLDFSSIALVLVSSICPMVFFPPFLYTFFLVLYPTIY